MADENANVGSATSAMIEALEKASADLERTVKASIEQLTAFNELVEKDFTSQLSKLSERSGVAVDSHQEELQIRKEDFAERLSDLGRTETETIISAAKLVRQQLALRSQQATESIAELVEEQLGKLRALTENPQSHFEEFGVKQIAEAETFADKHHYRIDEETTEHEKKLTALAQQLDDRIQDTLSDNKKRVDGTLEKHQGEFEEKIQSVIGQITELVDTTTKELESRLKKGEDAVSDYSAKARQKLSDRIQKWEGDLSSAADACRDRLGSDKDAFESIHSKKLDRKVGEVKNEINTLAQESLSKLNASHKLFHSSLKRLEKKYYDRIDRMFARFDNAVKQEGKLPTGNSAYRSQSNHELRDVLQARLKIRGEEIVKAFKRQVEQIDSEYSRYAAESEERVETIRSSSLESMEKQARQAQTEIERITRNFKSATAAENVRLPDINDAGRSAALAVMAYRSAMLSFSSD